MCQASESEREDFMRSGEEIDVQDAKAAIAALDKSRWTNRAQVSAIAG